MSTSSEQLPPPPKKIEFDREELRMLNHHDTQIELLKQANINIDKRFDQIDKTLLRMDAKFDRIDKRFDDVSKQFIEVHRQFADVHKSISAQNKWFIMLIIAIIGSPYFQKILDKIILHIAS